MRVPKRVVLTPEIGEAIPRVYARVPMKERRESRLGELSYDETLVTKIYIVVVTKNGRRPLPFFFFFFE